MSGFALKNLKLLKMDMEDKGWQIDSFVFRYKSQEYIVLVKLYSKEEKKPNYALLKLEFLRRGNINDNLEVPANSVSLMTDAQTLRKYFQIDYSENLGDLLQQFTQYFGTFIPEKVSNNKTRDEKDALVISLSKSDGEDVNKIYCFKVKRNPLKSNNTLGQRTPYNDNKTRLLRPTLYEKLGKETNISFCYSKNPEDEKSDDEILANWAQKNH